MRNSINTIIRLLKTAYPNHPFVEVNGTDPYRILISCILSLRTQDTVSLPATVRLFKAAPDIEKISRLSPDKLAKLIYPVGFYRTKARSIIQISKQLIKEHHGKVPNSREALLKFKGVGRKTANLVLSLGFQIPAICVDTHVHRISNRLGWVKTKTPEATEIALEKLLPSHYWIDINSLIVCHGQQICRPIKPRCERCPIHNDCQYFKQPMINRRVQKAPDSRKR